MKRLMVAGAVLAALGVAPAAAQQRGGGQTGQTGTTTGTSTGTGTAGTAGTGSALGTPTGTGTTEAAGQTGGAAALAGTEPSLTQTGTSGTAVENELATGDVLNLDQCLRAALFGSRDLLLARTRLALAETNVDQAWSVIRPQVFGSANLIRNDQEVTTTFPDPQTGDPREVVIRDLWQYGANVDVSQILFDGRAIPTLYALYASRDAEALSNDRLKTEVMFAVSTTFYQALALQEAVDVTERQVAEREEQLEATRARFEVGELNRVDLLRAQIDLTTVQEDLVTARANLISSKIALATLIGRPPAAGDFSLERPPAPALEMRPVDEQVDRAYGSRRDLDAAQKRVEAADHTILANKLAFLPQVRIGWQGNYSSAAGFSGGNFTWQGLLTLSWNILNGGQKFAEVQRANIQRRQAELTRDGLRDNIRKEVEQARLAFQSAASNLQRAEAVAELAVEQSELVQARYEAGLATSLDLTLANTRQFEAETNVVRQRLNLEVALLRLARSIGIFDEAVPYDLQTPASEG